MAFSSISNRLWLTYLIVVIFVLLIAFAGIAVAFRQSPLIYRQVFYRISLVNNFLKERLAIVLESEWAPFIRLFLKEINILDIKIAIINEEGEIIHLIEGTTIKELPSVSNPRVQSERSKDRILTFKDDEKNFWFYQVSQINEQFYLITTALRPDISIGTLFQDELLRPLLRAGIIALVLSFFLGWVIARWITRPLENISASTAQIAEGNYIAIPIEGPSEVQQLGRVINDMVMKVQDSLQSQQDFIANVSHEFKTPLTSIQGFAQALFDDVINKKTDRKKAASIILDETERLNHLVNDLLLLAKMDAGTTVIKKTKIDINQLIRNTLDKFQFQISNSMLELVVDLKDKLFIEIDGEKISQVLNNLLDNAIKYSPEGTEIRISSFIKEEWVYIEITDSGPGISEEDQKRIFERFFQIDKSRKSGPGRGVGLGLPIAKQIVQAHGGDIQVKSRLGSGSTFMVKLPFEYGQHKKKIS